MMDSDSQLGQPQEILDWEGKIIVFPT